MNFLGTKESFFHLPFQLLPYVSLYNIYCYILIGVFEENLHIYDKKSIGNINVLIRAYCTLIGYKHIFVNKNNTQSSTQLFLHFYNQMNKCSNFQQKFY